MTVVAFGLILAAATYIAFWARDATPANPWRTQAHGRRRRK
jgi:hypothetical protein